MVIPAEAGIQSLMLIMNEIIQQLRRLNMPIAVSMFMLLATGIVFI